LTGIWLVGSFGQLSLYQVNQLNLMTAEHMTVYLNPL